MLSSRAAALVLLIAGFAWPAGHAPAGEGPGGKEAAPPSSVGAVPERPFELLQRFFALSEAQLKQMAKLQEEWSAERRSAVERLDAELDAKYSEGLVPLLGEADAAKFARVRQATADYHAALAAAEAEYHAAWAAKAGQKTRWPPQSAVQMLANLPGLSGAERDRLNRDLYRDVYRRQNDEVNRALDAEGVAQPEDRNDAEAMRRYAQKRMAAYQAVRERLEAEFAKTVRERLTDEQRRMYDALMDIFAAYRAKKLAADETLTRALQPLVEAEKLTPPARPLPRPRPGRR